MQELNIEIQEKGKYKNINPKMDLAKNTYITVSKDKFAEAKEVPSKYEGKKSFIATATYQDVEVGFFLNEYEANSWNVTGGLGDKVKIIKDVKVATTGRSMNSLTFEKV